jgi:UDP-GlcNAc3NAcA epimerase
MKIITIIGARPQFIKAAALSRELKKHKRFNEIIVHTGQHFDKNMSDIFFREMEIPKPAYHLDVNNLSHSAMTGLMLKKIEQVLISEKPDLVLVYGDTNSTLAGALAASKLKIQLAHVEAGLRSFNMGMPEEINRIVTDRISNLLFCPTDTAVKNLRDEGFMKFKNCLVLKSGDVMQDAALYYSKKAAQKSNIIRDLKLNDFVLCTLHRAENTDDVNRFQSIVKALNAVNKKMRVVLPLHPRTRNLVKKLKIKLDAEVLDPVGYFDMIALLKNCRLVMTDSGGLQKEAFFFQKHCVTLRDDTEWNELVRNKYNVLAGAGTTQIIRSFEKMVNAKSDFSENFYGNGKACSNIASALKKFGAK